MAIDLLRTWPPRPHLVSRTRPPRLGVVRNNLRQAHNYKLLDHYVLQAVKLGHVIRGWSWTSPNTAEARCLECDRALYLDTYAARGCEADGSPILEEHCR